MAGLYRNICFANYSIALVLYYDLTTDSLTRGVIKSIDSCSPTGPLALNPSITKPCTGTFANIRDALPLASRL